MALCVDKEHIGRLLRHLTLRARALRRASTPAEKTLWALLRRCQLGVKFRRQQPLGPIIVDFCCIQAALVIELDGSHHRRGVQRRIDKARDALLRACGWTVLRFSNDDVLLHSRRVLEAIRSALATHQIPDLGPPDSLPSPSGRGAGGEGTTLSKDNERITQ